MPLYEHRNFFQHYEISGFGPSLVWAHGIYMSSEKDESFFSFFDEFRKEFSLLTFDARGHGYSSYTQDSKDYTWESLSDDLRSLLFHLNFNRSFFIGASMGGMTLLKYAMDNPDMVKALILFAPTCVGTDIIKLKRQTRVITNIIKSSGINAISDFILNTGPWGALEEKNPEKIEKLRRNFKKQSIEGIISASQGVVLSEVYSADNLKKLSILESVPILIIADPEDSIHPLSSAKQLSDVLPMAELVVAPSGFYYFFNTEELFSIMLNFLKKHL